ncbi:LCP family protein [Auraticoccus monumenti]|nr:LCP family protein [Auraticoccus monumenti]
MSASTPTPDGPASARGGRHADQQQAAFSRSAGWTTLGALLPGAGLIRAGHRVAGGIVLGIFLAAVLGLGLWALVGRSSLLAVAVDPSSLNALSAALAVVAVLWVAVIVTTNLALRPRGLATAQRALSGVLVAVLAFVVAAPMAVAARYSHDQAGVVASLFKSQGDSKSATRPTVEPGQADPWAGTERLNVLLLGGDSGDGRSESDGIRTDTVIVASVDTSTGDTTLISLPRNTARMPFPDGSELDEIYPNGFYDGYDGDNQEYALNAMYSRIPAENPGAVGETDHEGADVLKVSVSEALGLDIDYYALVDLDGFAEMVDALGGITVNINTHVPVGGNTDRGIYPDRWLEPGENVHLKGWDALWFARGRYGGDDFKRMGRQRCVVDAVIKQANPQTIITRYEAIARASKDIAQTDVPQEMLPALLELALRAKDGKSRSVLFVNGEQGFISANPDWTAVRKRVAKALDETEQKPRTSEASSEPTGAEESPSAEPSDSPEPSASSSADGGSTSSPEPTEASQSNQDACAWDPESARRSYEEPHPTVVR